ncbi:hypothetical protein [Sphaerotilus mobilis]|uniref:Uncharacterized protein n=1 Tax=Sphaerotilus mobilis TaxID=47994 RepID=A0A4Q7LLG6_9BURK|nr:hypothetical protein [Sphaerotilus mobilis]RZS54747.1 hypothetical protein EV685_2231 [Sphaerotilus mobilis]
MSSKRIHKLTMAWGVMGTLSMLAASAVLASPAARVGSAPRVERVSRPGSVPAPVVTPVAAPVAAPASDARLDQFVADARALWPDLSPDVREMVLELVRSRGRQAELAAFSGLDAASTQLADARKLQATQAIVTE